ncbi:hypothetical protein [Arthrobacter sp. NPDC092385]|uniref:hypothetical protein n=1 Tax=Arthrobacter sp. NPDC092385 TaxID=3363943 RepID=UPI00130D7797|nr:hypothetical protein [Vibrio cholerae]
MVDREDVITSNRETLEAFVARSRRVDAHSLMSNPAHVQALSTGQIKLRVVPQTGEQFLVQDLPVEEVLESAAARLRPLILQEDPVYWGRALNAIGYFLKDSQDQEAKDVLAEMRRLWQERVAPTPGKERGYFLQMRRVGGDSTSTIVDTDLGMSWFYGDVVHADKKRRAAGARYGITERFRAATMLVANGLICNHLTLRFIRDLKDAGLLELSDEVFTEEVTVTETHFEQAAKFYVGKAGTAMPEDITGTIPAGFEEFDPEKHVPTRGAGDDQGG